MRRWAFPKTALLNSDATERLARTHPYSSATRAGVRLLGAEIARERKRAAVTAADLARARPDQPGDLAHRLPPPDRETFGSIRDAAPDAWGQRVILSRMAGRLTRDSDHGAVLAVPLI